MLGPVVMPMDVAMRFYLAQSPSPPMRGLLASSSSYEDLQRGVWTRPPPRPQKGSALRGPVPLRPCLSVAQRGATDGGKKRVVFADAQGLALTAVRLFSDHRGPRAAAAAVEDLMFQMGDLEAVAVETKKETKDRSGPAPLELDFRPPASDYLEFRSRLLRNAVCLESCVLRRRSLSGTVKVRNLGFSKAVALRLTLDAWDSFSETACTFMNDVYGGPDTDTFAFALELPAATPPATRGGVEFCVCFRVEGQEFWDNNDGRNYALKQAGLNEEEEEKLPTSSSPGPPPTGLRRAGDLPGRSGGAAAAGVLDLDADQFGSPRTSSGLFPRWQSWGTAEVSRPYW